MDDAWTIERQDSIAHRLDGCKAIVLTTLNSVQSLL
jgi:hypothetical protein